MVQCYVCQGKRTFRHLGRAICQKCFVRQIEKRVKKHLGRKLFKKCDSVLVVGEVEKELLKKAVGDLPLDLTFSNELPPSIKNFDHIVVGVNMDQIDETFLTGLFEGKLQLENRGIELKKNSEQENMFNILEPLTEDEVKLYSKIKKIKLNLKARKNLGREFLDRLKEFNEIKYNVYKNIKELRNLCSGD